MAKTAQENAGYWRRGGLVGDAKQGKITTSVTNTTVGKPKAPSKTTPSKPSKPVKPPTPRGGGGPVNPPTMRKTVTVGAKSKAPTRSKSPTVTHVNATALPPTKKKRT